MKVKLSSILVDDQAKALDFYTRALGFVKQADVSLGEYRWLTVSSPEGIAGVEVVLEPLAFAPARVYQKALYEAGIPATAFFTDDIAAEVGRLKANGVVFRTEPSRQGPVIVALFDDSCGNLINLVQLVE